MTESDNTDNVPESSAKSVAPEQTHFVLRTDPGRVRPLNEDAIGAAPSAGLYILADGLGGYNAGEIASTLAVSALLEELTRTHQKAVESTDFLLDPARVLRDALIGMNTNIYRAALNSAAFEGMATTIVVAWLVDETLWAAHAGDSRLYRFREGKLEQLTRDHSFSQELLDAGMVTEEEARQLPAKNLVTRALGASVDLEPEVHPYDVQEGDLLLLCSDGLTEMVNHHEMEGLLANTQRGLSEVAQSLIDMANEAGGRDNISIVLVRVCAGLREQTGMVCTLAEIPVVADVLDAAEGGVLVAADSGHMSPIQGGSTIDADAVFSENLAQRPDAAPL